MYYFNSIPNTYGVANIAGTVNPTPTLKMTQAMKECEKAVATPNMHSINKYMKNDGLLPRLSCKYPNI